MRDNHSLVTKDSTLMEYSPKEMAFIDYNPNLHEGPSFRDHLKVIFRQKMTILMTFIMVIAAAYVGLQLRTPLYEAHVKLVIRAEKIVESPYYRDLDGSFKTEVGVTQSEIVKSNPVLERTVKSLRLDERPIDYEKAYAKPLRQLMIDFRPRPKGLMGQETEESLRFKNALGMLRKRVKVKPIPNTNLLSISAQDFDPMSSAAIANTISRYYVIFDLEQQLAELQTKYGDKHMAVTQLHDDIRKLEERLKETTNSYIDIMGPASVKVLEQANVPTEPVGFSSALILLLAAACGLCLGVALAFLFEHMDPTVRSAEDVEKYLNVPLLGSVPLRKFGSKLLKRDSLLPSRYNRAFEDLADQIHLIVTRGGLSSVLVAPTASGEGASTVTANLAVYLSKHLNHKVLLIDSNLRQPAIHKLFKTPEGGGFADVLAGKAPIEESVFPVNENLDVLPAGQYRGNPLMLFDPERVTDTLQHARGLYEIVLLDSTNLKDFKDAQVLSTLVDSVALVIESGRTRYQTVRAVLTSLERKKVNILGAVLNKRVFHVPEIIYDRV